MHQNEYKHAYVLLSGSWDWAYGIFINKTCIFFPLKYVAGMISLSLNMAINYVFETILMKTQKYEYK